MSGTPISRDGKLITTGNLVRRGKAGTIIGVATNWKGNTVEVTWQTGKVSREFPARSLSILPIEPPALAPLPLFPAPKRKRAKR